MVTYGDGPDVTIADFRYRSDLLAISFCLQETANEQSGEDERRVRPSRNSLATTGPNSSVKTATGKVLWGQSVENREGLRIGM
jgi:hypothetical protein